MNWPPILLLPAYHIALSPWQQRPGPPLRRARIDADVDDLCLGYVQHLVAALRLDADLHRDRGPADAHQSRQEAHHVADVDRLVKLDAIERDRHQHRAGAAGADDLAASADG